jgi:hypothetical protein
MDFPGCLPTARRGSYIYPPLFFRLIGRFRQALWALTLESYVRKWRPRRFLRSAGAAGSDALTLECYVSTPLLEVALDIRM